MFQHLGLREVPSQGTVKTAGFSYGSKGLIYPLLTDGLSSSKLGQPFFEWGLNREPRDSNVGFLSA